MARDQRALRGSGGSTTPGGVRCGLGRGDRGAVHRSGHLQSEPNGATAAGLLYTAPTLGSTAAERFFALSIAGARKTLYITNSYFAPDRNFIDLLSAAARRGVDVRILTAGPRTDVNVVRLAGRAWYDTLLAAGVRVYEWQPRTLHAKTFVVDSEWFTVGSMNFDNRSMALNDEATLMVLDRTAGQNMNRIFLDDLRHAEEITHRSVPQALVASANCGVGRELPDAVAVMQLELWQYTNSGSCA